LQAIPFHILFVSHSGKVHESDTEHTYSTPIIICAHLASTCSVAETYPNWPPLSQGTASITMSLVGDLTDLVIRQSAAAETESSCNTSNEYNGRLGLRVAAIFVIWLGSSVGACFPIYAKRNKGLKVPEWTFFVAKYFGSSTFLRQRTRR
jgi:hypothetical protein